MRKGGLVSDQCQQLGVAPEYKDDSIKWKKAIQKDGHMWSLVSGLAYFDEPVAKLYSIRSIPQNFLIEPSRKIIGRNLTNESLLNTLTGIFK